MESSGRAEVAPIVTLPRGPRTPPGPPELSELAMPRMPSGTDHHAPAKGTQHDHRSGSDQVPGAQLRLLRDARRLGVGDRRRPGPVGPPTGPRPERRGT